MGGGTGFAPLKGMLEHMFHKDITRPVHLFWGAHSKQDLYLHELPLHWQKEHANFSYTPVLSHPFPEDEWTGETGLVTDAVVAAYPDLSKHDIYMSGPPAMINAATPLFVDHQADMHSMYSDAFEFAKDVLDKLTAKG
jgi:CDP-4-dehydro-6-deoxyglucose reductase